jgi:hypothetical protein
VCSFSNVTSRENSLLLSVKHNTEQTVANTDPETLRKVARNTLKRVDACLRDGGHFQYML